MQTLRSLKMMGYGLEEAVRFLESRQDISASPARLCSSPVFLLSAGWRSGSTLLQRLICSGNDILLWGEPFEYFAPLHRMALTIEPIRDDPFEKYTIPRMQGDLSSNWIANLNPGTQALRGAHLAYAEAMYAQPGREAGYSRWGCKWVRATGHHAYYLKWLYPDAKFVFLVRHPMDAYSSYRGRKWFLVWGSPVKGPVSFFEHWRLLAESFLSEARQIGGMVIRYEDIVSGSAVLDQLSQYLGVELNREVLTKRVGASKDKRASAGWWPRVVASARVGRCASRFGYDLSGKVADRWEGA